MLLEQMLCECQLKHAKVHLYTDRLPCCRCCVSDSDPSLGVRTTWSITGDDFLCLIGISSLDSGATFRTVVSGLCILNEDFEALRFEKNDFDESRACLGVCPGEFGKGGNEAKEGELGDEGDTDDFTEIA